MDERQRTAAYMRNRQGALDSDPSQVVYASFVSAPAEEAGMTNRSRKNERFPQNITVQRVGSSANIDDDGAYFRVHFSGRVSAEPKNGFLNTVNIN